MRYVALIVRRSDWSSKNWMSSQGGESKERFVERVKNCYIKPYDIPYWDVEVYELGEEIDL